MSLRLGPTHVLHLYLPSVARQGLTCWGQPREEKGKRAEENHVSRTSGSAKQNQNLSFQALSLRAQPHPPHQLPLLHPCRASPHHAPGSTQRLASLPALQLPPWPQPLSARLPSSPPCDPVERGT